jgi:hypothetical protein
VLAKSDFITTKKHNNLLVQFRDLSSSYVTAGPRRVNHASVSIDDYIYSFGGYCSGEDYRLSRPMDVHVLNTNNLRWSLLSTRKDKKYPNVPFQRYGESNYANVDYKLSVARMCSHAVKLFFLRNPKSGPKQERKKLSISAFLRFRFFLLPLFFRRQKIMKNHQL